MPRYNYICNTCAAKAVTVAHVDDLYELPNKVLESEVLFETSHCILPTKKELEKARECPRCGGTDCDKTPYGCDIYSYIRGYGWLDKPGIKRDMNVHTLTNNDPYAEYREPGEVDHIKSDLESKGRHDPKTQYFPTAKPDLTDEVKKATGS